MHPPNVFSARAISIASRGNARETPPPDSGEEEFARRSSRVAALLVMPSERRALFLQALSELDVPVYCVEDCREARRLLQPTPAVSHTSSVGLPVGLIVTHVSLPDGNWCDVLRMMNQLGAPASVVVDATEVNPTLWSEVFWRGAYDLLVQPCDWNDVCQCLEGALRSRPRRLASSLSSS
ncbi:MAG: hypothetical protein WD733_02450 [Bryobacterales bacterium]